MLAERLRIGSKATRELLAQLDVRVSIPLPYLGRLEDTWLFRADRAPRSPLSERLAGVPGVVGFVEFDAPYALVRTNAQDAVDREKTLRALHQRFHERPMMQLHRPAPPALKRRPTRADWALIAALRKHRGADAVTLAREARVPLKGARERLARLAQERVVVLDATPRAAPLAHVLLRLSPTSTAAARRAFDTVDDVVRAWLPMEGETTSADALVLGAPSLERARDVPGIASAELLPLVRSWNDEASLDALVKKAMIAAPP